MKFFVRMKIVYGYPEPFVQAVLTDTDPNSLRRQFDGDTYAEVIYAIFKALGPALTKDGNELDVTFHASDDPIG